MLFLEWHTLSKASWFAYGTLMGEAITRDTKSGKSQALRIVIATWLLYCLIISQGYAGSLKAYLTTPAFSNPIDTLQQVSADITHTTFKDFDKIYLAHVKIHNLKSKGAISQVCM